ncbi:MAG: Ig-like domain-containing protein, partial [Lachnospiraceae bacterium]|nr:Ig-like domain-containing protein [Lachnospiraceae bacterium]
EVLVADAEGKFTVSGNLVSCESSRVLTLEASDSVGNISETVGTAVSRVEDITHTVTFEDGFGNVIATQVVKHGKDASVPVVPTHAGYIFDGWDREFKNIEANIRITALWKPGSTPAPKPSGGSGSGGQSTQKDVKVSSIKLTGVSTKIAAGKKIKLTAEVKPDNATNKTLKWSSSNTKVATVDQNGTVKVSKSAGGKKVTITAEAADGSGKKATFKITVMKKAVTSLSLSGKKSAKAGSKVKLKAKVKAPKGANKKLKWTCDKPEYATVNSKGVVKTKKSGKGKTVKITVMTTDGSNKKKTIKIKLK